MTIYFASSIDHLTDHKNSEFCYFFTVQPHTDSNRAYIKLGYTDKQSLIHRLKRYIAEGITPLNIYYKYVSNPMNREIYMIRLFKSHSEIHLFKGREYFDGPYQLMIRLFCFSVSNEEDQVEQDLLNKNIITTLKKATRFNPSITYLTQPTIISDSLHTVDMSDESDESDEKEEMLSELNCSKCGRLCKDRRGLAIHENKCDKNREVQCGYCQMIFSCSRSLTRHYTTCRVYKDIQQNKERDKYKELEEKYNKLTEEYRQVIFCQDQILQEKISIACGEYINKIKEQEVQIQFLQTKNEKLSTELLDLMRTTIKKEKY
jgi:hypothetical protein